jgi:hypothetical protein
MGLMHRVGAYISVAVLFTVDYFHSYPTSMCGDAVHERSCFASEINIASGNVPKTFNYNANQLVNDLSPIGTAPNFAALAASGAVACNDSQLLNALDAAAGGASNSTATAAAPSGVEDFAESYLNAFTTACEGYVKGIDSELDTSADRLKIPCGKGCIEFLANAGACSVTRFKAVWTLMLPCCWMCMRSTQRFYPACQQGALFIDLFGNQGCVRVCCWPFPLYSTVWEGSPSGPSIGGVIRMHKNVQPNAPLLRHWRPKS